MVTKECVGWYIRLEETIQGVLVSCSKGKKKEES